MGRSVRTVSAFAALVSIGVSPRRAAAETPTPGAARPAPTQAVVPLSAYARPSACQGDVFADPASRGKRITNVVLPAPERASRVPPPETTISLAI
jgi:hypothetical protein